MSKISYLEYKQRVFNEALLECFSRFHAMCLTESTETGVTCSPHTSQMMDKMARVFFSDMLDLPHSTVKTTMKKLDNSVTFVKDCCKLCETIADLKSAKAAEENLDIEDGQKIELSKEDQELINTVFDNKNPETQASVIRDATVNALLAEDKKSQEIKAAIDMAKSSSNADTLEETVRRLDNGPTSLMHAILNNFSQLAVRDVNESSKSVISAGEVMRNNADEIKTRATMLYTLYEMANALGIHKYTEAEIKNIAEHIYYNK